MANCVVESVREQERERGREERGDRVREDLERKSIRKHCSSDGRFIAGERGEGRGEVRIEWMRKGGHGKL